MKISRPWPMPGLQRARPAGPEQAYPRSGTRSGTKLLYLATSYVEIVHWSMFKKEKEAMGAILMKMAVLLRGNACRKSLYEVISYLKSYHLSIFKKEVSHISLMA